MRPHRPRIPQRRRVFLGCEGESEQSYGALIARMIEVRHRRIHIDAVLLQPGAGDPLGLVERAVRQIRNRSERAGAFSVRAILLDSDKRDEAPQRSRQAMALAREHGIHLIWQEPCHEGLLLRHFVGCEQLRPIRSDQAIDDLRRHWPEYRKGMASTRLASVIDEACVSRAAGVEPALRAFLQAIEFAQG